MSLFDFNKEDLALRLAGFTILSSITVGLIDLGALAIGHKAELSLPLEYHATNGLILTGFFGYIIGKTQKK